MPGFVCIAKTYSTNVKGWWIAICTVLATSIILFAFPFYSSDTIVPPENSSKSIEGSSSGCEELSEVVTSPLWLKGTEVVVANIIPSLLYAIPSSESECSNSIGSAVKKTGVFAPYEALIMYHVLKDKCKEDPNTIVYDVGANIGFFSILAA
mmetsp:Transcript_6412/g.6961  ORF Transcript_6412/g.6961 Transcript_6412/m.6961 type:complete len:152 (-) Transcript_6412:5-460(-)